MKHRDSSFTDAHATSASYSLSTPNTVSYENESTPSSATSRISPILLLILVIVAVVFFIFGLVHLLIRYLKKRPSPLPNHQSNRFPETTLQTQLQQLFRLHDSGLDQSLIDALPMFCYKDIVGLKEPFDCAVCLCEFSEHDKLRGTLSSSDNSLENPVSSFDVSREISTGFTTDEENGFSGRHKPENVQESATPKRVFSVRLGKFKSINGDNRERVQGEMSICNKLDARRCYSMGAFQYVLVDSDLQVALSNHIACDGTGSSNSLVDGELEGKKISERTRGESYSVSKIWLWPKKSRLPSSSSNAHMAELGLASSRSYYKFANEL
ncbi:RING-H2 finger protein ATL46 [Citrus sinensis]|nr:RING-H2 finger protein ATL46 [Citrus sinensis]